MRRYRGTFDNFFGVEHRMRKEEMEEQLNKEAKQGWRFAADTPTCPTVCKCARRYACFLRKLLALGRLDPEE